MTERNYLRDEISNMIASEIVAGKIFPGEKITAISISERFGVSRTPAREALVLLEKRGFVEFSKNSGATVRKIDETKLLETIDICAVLEGRAVELAISGKCITDPDIEKLQVLHNSMERYVEEGEFSEYINSNIEFHQFFITKCPNEEIRKIHDEMNERVHIYRKFGFPVRSADLRDFLKTHLRLIGAIRENDSFHARYILEQHVREGRRTLPLNSI